MWHPGVRRLLLSVPVDLLEISEQQVSGIWHHTEYSFIDIADPDVWVKAKVDPRVERSKIVSYAQVQGEEAKFRLTLRPGRHS